jgi:hypothetical protein
MAAENPTTQSDVKTSSEVKASVLHGVKDLKIVPLSSFIQIRV